MHFVTFLSHYMYIQELEIEVEMLRDDKRKLMKDKLSVQTELDDHKCKQMDNERVWLCTVHVFNLKVII